MKTKLFFLLITYSSIIVAGVYKVNAQGAWAPKANFGGTERNFAVGFSIGNKGYIGTGNYIGSYTQDFWEWDQATNVWTQKANFGGGGRKDAVGFSIGKKGYIGTGNFNGSSMRDFWEWDQAMNVWIQKANFGGAARTNAVGFSIGTKGYIGTGNLTKDFWEWDPATNVWTEKANFGGGAREDAVGFSIANKGYIGAGYDANYIYAQDFWEWDPTTNSWTQKANFAGSPRSGEVGFSMGNKGYIQTSDTANNFWELDPITNVWTKKANFGGAWIADAVGFSIGNKGYIGTGSLTKVFWEFNPDCSFSLSGTTSYICIGGNATLSAAYTPSSNNITYSWSPNVGLNNTTIPNPVVSPSISTTYQVVAQDTVLKCMAFGSYTLQVYPVYSVSGPYQICKGQSLSLCASGGINYSWSTGQTTSCIAVSPSTTDTYTVQISDIHGCHVSGTTTVSVNCTGVSSCNNQDFETGNFQNWTGLSGNRQNSATVISWTGGFNYQGNDVPSTNMAQHTILTKNTLDPLCVDPNTNKPDTFMTALAPGGGNYSIRLGNSYWDGYAFTTGKGAEKLQLSFIPTFTNSVFSYQFASVFSCSDTMTSPPHNFFEWPGFITHVYDRNNAIIPGLSDTVYAENPKKPFITSLVKTPDFEQLIRYKRWNARSLNLLQYVGQNLTIDFTNFDCATGSGFHFGYTYLDVSCNDIFTWVNNTIPDERFSVFPNPTGGIFQIQANNDESLNICIYNVMGEKIYEMYDGQRSSNSYREASGHSSNISPQPLTIDISSQPAGVYFIYVKTTTDSGSYGNIVKKIMKE